MLIPLTSKKQKVQCNACGGMFSVNASGEIHGHKCVVVNDRTDWKKKYDEAVQQISLLTRENQKLKDDLHETEKKVLRTQIEALKSIQDPVTPKKL